MLVSEILNTESPFLVSTDKVSTAIEKFKACRTDRLIVVDKEMILLGMLSKTAVKKADDKQAAIEELNPDPIIFVNGSSHIFEAARLLFAYDKDSLPVVDGIHKYLGVVLKSDLMEALGRMFNLVAAGSVIEVEIAERDYTLSDVIRIIETEGGKILGVSVEQPLAENGFYRVSFKLNLEDSSVVSAALRRFGYEIISEESSKFLEYDFSERADELIRYLDI